MKCPKCGSENITQENKGQETAEILIKNGVKVVGYTIAKALGHRKIGKMLFSHETSTTKNINAPNNSPFFFDFKFNILSILLFIIFIFLLLNFDDINDILSSFLYFIEFININEYSLISLISASFITCSSQDNSHCSKKSLLKI